METVHEIESGILHAHKCSKCGRMRSCSKSPCVFRPFDVHPTTRERYVCCYEPPLIPRPDALAASWKSAGSLAYGVRGTAYEQGGFIYIPLITADHEGSGDVGRFLDSLSPRCLILDVTSERLRGMLRRRGWQHVGVAWKRH